MNGLFVAKHPLDGAISASGIRHDNHVEVLSAPLVLSVAALPKREDAVSMAMEIWNDHDLRTVGPGEWLLVHDHQDQSVAATLHARLEGQALVTDQSSGRAVLRLVGPDCRAILAKCTPLDLHPDVFAIGQSGNALFCHVGANIVRLDEDMFEISLMRSFALFAFEELMEMGLEYGLTAGFAT